MLAIICAGLYGTSLTLIKLDYWNFADPATKVYISKLNQVFQAVFTLVAAYGLLNTLNSIIRWYTLNTDSRSVVHQIEIIKKITNAVVMGIMIAMALNQLGYKVSALLATLGVAGLSAALALQDTLANMFGGFYIMADKSIKAGDYIKLESGDEGFVEEVGWRSTRIRLWSNNMVILPNSKLIQNKIINYDLPQQQLSIYPACGVSYDSDLDHVERVAIDVAREVLTEVPGGVTDYNPVVRFKEFGDSNIKFTTVLRAKDASSQYLLHHEFIKRLHRRFREEGIEISYPRQVVQVMQVDN
jgi:small-conductance mechanosensitive channel